MPWVPGSSTMVRRSLLPRGPGHWVATNDLASQESTGDFCMVAFMDIKLNQVFLANEPLPDAMMAMTCIQRKKKKRQSYLTCRQQLSFFFALWVASLHQFPNDAFDLWHRLLPVGIAWVWRCSTFHLHIQAHTELPRPQIETPMSKDLSGRWHRWHGWPLWPWLIHGAGRCC